MWYFNCHDFSSDVMYLYLTSVSVQRVFTVTLRTEHFLLFPSGSQTQQVFNKNLVHYLLMFSSISSTKPKKLMSEVRFTRNSESSLNSDILRNSLIGMKLLTGAHTSWLFTYVREAGTCSLFRDIISCIKKYSLTVKRLWLKF